MQNGTNEQANGQYPEVDFVASNGVVLKAWPCATCQNVCDGSCDDFEDWNDSLVADQDKDHNVYIAWKESQGE